MLAAPNKYIVLLYGCLGTSSHMFWLDFVLGFTLAEQITHLKVSQLLFITIPHTCLILLDHLWESALLSLSFIFIRAACLLLPPLCILHRLDQCSRAYYICKTTLDTFLYVSRHPVSESDTMTHNFRPCRLEIIHKTKKT